MAGKLTEDEGLLSLDDAMNIGFKIAEMADRVRVGHKVLPGCQAAWGFEIDDVRFSVIVKVADGPVPAALKEPNDG